MLNAISETDRRFVSPEQLAMMQTIFESVCAELHVPLNHRATREAIAHKILRQFELGNHDVVAVTEAARQAARVIA